MKITIYHNPACGTSRNTLALIREAGHEPKIVEYLKTPLSRAEIVSLLGHMNTPAHELVRSKEALFKELGLDGENIGEEQMIDAMAAHPILVNRPVVAVEDGGKVTARLCRPADLVTELLAPAG
jgi:arsenate reductase